MIFDQTSQVVTPDLFRGPWCREHCGFGRAAPYLELEMRTATKAVVTCDTATPTPIDKSLKQGRMPLTLHMQFHIIVTAT